jgi:pimeloyl-ACP methyl ester carboxylesterase
MLFSGLGADERLFEPQRCLPVRLELPRWPEAQPGDTVEQYSQRLARNITPGPDLYVGGVSFGAIVALEVARHVPVRGVFLIGGCRSARQVVPLFRFACRAASYLPLPMVRLVQRIAAPPLKLFEKLNREQTRLYARMFREASATQVRWAAGALTRWESRVDPPAPVYAIHGQWDEVIPLRNVLPPDRVVRHGRHLISLTRPAEVNAFLMEKMCLTGATPAREISTVPATGDAARTEVL